MKLSTHEVQTCPQRHQLLSCKWLLPPLGRGKKRYWFHKSSFCATALNWLAAAVSEAARVNAPIAPHSQLTRPAVMVLVAWWRGAAATTAVLPLPPHVNTFIGLDASKSCLCEKGLMHAPQVW